MRSLFRNKFAEKDIRDWLSQNGFFGKSARFAEIELHATKRPGWLQVFRFELRGLTSDYQCVQLFGAMRSDERYGSPKIFVHEDSASRDARLVDWSVGLITHRRHRKHAATSRARSRR